jgi:hypothetical protein
MASPGAFDYNIEFKTYVYLAAHNRLFYHRTKLLIRLRYFKCMLPFSVPIPQFLIITNAIERT